MEVGIKVQAFQRSGNLHLPPDILPFIADYICLIHAFCWLATTGLGNDPVAVYCRSALREFWLGKTAPSPPASHALDPGHAAPSSGLLSFDDAVTMDHSKSGPEVSEVPVSPPGNAQELLKASIVESGCKEAQGVAVSGLPPPPSGSSYCLAAPTMAPAVELDAFDWGTRPKA